MKRTYDDLDMAIATEEHDQGLVLPHAGHCEACDVLADEERLAELRRTCAHDEVIDLRTLGEVQGEQICATCGATLREAW